MDGQFEVRVKGPSKSWRYGSPHYYTTLKAPTAAAVGLIVEHTYAAPWHGENGKDGCPMCVHLAEQRIVLAPERSR